MSLLEFDNGLIFGPIAAAIVARGAAEFALLVWSHPLIVAMARAVKAAAIPFAVAFYVVLLTQQIQMGM